MTDARSTPGGEIGSGLVVLLGVAEGDTEAEAERLAGKIARLRIFENESGKFDRSLLDTGGAALVVSQFTLIADSRRQKGTRPDFSGAAPKAQANCSTCGSAPRYAPSASTSRWASSARVWPSSWSMTAR